MDEKTPPTEKEVLSIRGLPTWAADVIRNRADRTGQTYAGMVRIILTDAALRYAADTPVTPAPVVAVPLEG